MIMNMDVTRYISEEELNESYNKPKEFTEEYYQTKLGGL